MSPLPDLFPIEPFTAPVRGFVTLPGSKSLTNRTLILAALANGKTLLHSALFSRDTCIMISALRALGFEVTSDESAKTIEIVGRDGEIPATEATLHVGNAGNAARFLTAFVCLRKNGVFHFDSDEEMRLRPISALIDALESQGAQASARAFPFTLRTFGLKGGEIKIDASESSQMLSALLMVAPLADNDVTIRPVNTLRMPFVEMTNRLMTDFAGASASHQPHDGSFHSVCQHYRAPGVYQIEPDASAASYFETLPVVVGGTLSLTGLNPPGHSLQGDAHFLSVIQKIGAEIVPQSVPETTPNSMPSGKRGTEIEVHWDKLRSRRVLTEDFSTFSDTFLTLAALAPLLDGPTRISGIAHTRKQETNRVTGMARELTKLGQRVIETEGALEIHPRPLVSGIEIETYKDHRFAMSFGILGCHDLHGSGRAWLAIKDPACCSKTFPSFFDLLAQLRASSH